ncbi:hypothetical protein H4K36_01290 [Streptomyces sp. DHE7-1]|nr:hypothetical protein [Streptomyces sp. DHE7-1]
MRAGLARLRGDLAASELMASGAAIAGVVAGVGAIFSPGHSTKAASASAPVPAWMWPGVLIALALLLMSVVWVLWGFRKAKAKEIERKRDALESAADRLAEKMELPSLVNFNRVLLDKYHGIATDQATKAYRSSRLAMWVGIIVLVVAFLAGWHLNAQGDRLFVGSVAAVGTAFTAYLSRTFMQTYERALQQLNQYFNQPVLNSYFLTAERIADKLPKDSDLQNENLVRVLSDVLESGKEMHRIASSANSQQASAPKPRQRRKAAQAEASVPEQQTQ